MTDFWEQLAHAPLREPLHIATDPDGIEIFLSREQWENHILQEHLKMEKYRDYIIPTVTDPDEREWERLAGEDRYAIIYYAKIPPLDPATPVSRRMRVVVKYLKPAVRQYKLTGLISSAFVMYWRGD